MGDPTAATPPLIESRSCGSCNVCCVALTIDDEALAKPQGIRCRNANRENGCKIYDTRPGTCRTFFCGWRTLRFVREPLRPDLSGVLIRLHIEVSATGVEQKGIIVTLLHARALHAEGLAETIAAAVNANAPVYLNVPGPPGYTSSQAKMNDALSIAVLTKDKEGLLNVLRDARSMGRKGERTRIVLKSKAAGAAAG